MPRIYGSADTTRTRARIRRGKSSPGTRNVSTVSSPSTGGKREYLTVGGTPTISRPTKRAKAESEAKQVRTSLSRVRKAYKSGPDYGKTFDANEAATLVKSVGGTDEEARALSTKVSGESGGNPKAIGDDAAAGYGNTFGLGLWQMTTGVGNDDLIAKHGGEKAMLKPKPNARAALELYRGGGIDNWYAASTAPGEPGKVEPKIKPKPKDLKIVRKAGVEPKKAAPKPKKRPGPWAGAQKAVLAKVPSSVRPEGRGDKRTPEENSSVGGATNSDHLTTNQKSYAADLPADDNVARHIAKKLGMGSHTGTNQITKDGYEYTLIWQDEGHYDHIHIGAEWVGPGVPDGTTLGGPSGGGTSLASTSGSTSTGGSATSGTTGKSGTAAKKKQATLKQRLRRVQGAYSSASTSSSGVPASLQRKYGSPVV